MRRRSHLALLLVALCCALAGASGGGAEEQGSSGESTTLEALMESLAASGGVRAHFRETKHLALLTEPLETEGVVIFAPPDRLARLTRRPGTSSVVVVGSRVEIRDETGETVVTLDEDYPARHFVDNLAVLLRGDLAALRARYEVDFQASEAGWGLDLEPRSRVMRRLVESIRAEGKGPELHRMELRETSGDSTVTVFFDVKTGLDYSVDLEKIDSFDWPSVP